MICDEPGLQKTMKQQNYDPSDNVEVCLLKTMIHTCIQVVYYDLTAILFGNLVFNSAPV